MNMKKMKITNAKKVDLIESYNRTKELVDKLSDNEVKEKLESELKELKLAQIIFKK